MTHESPQIRSNFISAITTSIGIGASLGFVAFSGIVRRLSPSEQMRTHAFSAIIGSLIIIFVLLIYVYNSRTDFFLLKYAHKQSALYYQLFGNYLIILVICVFSSAYIVALRYRENPFYAFMIFVALISTLTLFLSQIAGANKATILVVLIGGGIMLFGIFEPALRAKRGWIGRTAFVSCVGAVCLLGAWAVASNIAPMRMFGFKPTPHFPLSFSPSAAPVAQPAGPVAPVDGTSIEQTFAEDIEASDEEEANSETDGESDPSFSSLNNSSVSSRVGIWEDYALKQLKVAPVFGDLAADRIVTGKRGQYLHSLASIQTHLGLVGSVLMAGFLLQRLWQLWRSPRQLVLKVTAPAIIAVALASSFFTWMPFWFVVGALYAPRAVSTDGSATP